MHICRFDSKMPDAVQARQPACRATSVRGRTLCETKFSEDLAGMLKLDVLR